MSTFVFHSSRSDTPASRVGHLRFTFKPDRLGIQPHVLVQASRPSVIMSGNNVFNRATGNVSYPIGSVTIDSGRQEVYGWNDERQEWVHPFAAPTDPSRILLSEELPAKGFKGYFVARFSEPFEVGGVSFKGDIRPDLSAEGKELSGWVKFASQVKTVDVRVGVSFISVEQARR